MGWSPSKDQAPPEKGFVSVVLDPKQLNSLGLPLDSGRPVEVEVLPYETSTIDDPRLPVSLQGGGFFIWSKKGAEVVSGSSADAANTQIGCVKDGKLTTGPMVRREWGCEDENDPDEKLEMLLEDRTTLTNIPATTFLGVMETLLPPAEAESEFQPSVLTRSQLEMITAGILRTGWKDNAEAFLQNGQENGWFTFVQGTPDASRKLHPLEKQALAQFHQLPEVRELCEKMPNNPVKQDDVSVGLGAKGWECISTPIEIQNCIIVNFSTL